MSAHTMSIEQRVQEAVDTFVARVRHELDAQLNSLTSELLRIVHGREANSRTEVDQAVAHPRAESEATVRPKLDAQRAELTRDMELRRLADRSELQLATVVREGRVDTLERLLASVRRLDESMTLSGILEALARGAAAETSRVAILLVDVDMLRIWGHFGFAANSGPIDLPVSHAGVLTTAVALQRASFVPPAPDPRATASPAFMRVPEGSTGVAVPIIVGAEVVAVLYADDVDSLPEQEDAPVWTEEIELLVRHASLRLEHVTSVRTVEVLTKPA